MINMETDKSKTQIFLVLVPHRDARVELRRQSEELIKKGLTNIYPFPHAAVLAILSKPLNTNELKQIARAIREKTGNNKFYTNETSSVKIKTDNKELNLFGPKLEFDASCALGMSADKIKTIISPPIIGSFIIPDGIEQKNQNILYYSSLSFRAAAAANMHWRPVKIKGEVCYKWKIGKLSWLPNPSRKICQLTEANPSAGI